MPLYNLSRQKKNSLWLFAADQWNQVKRVNCGLSLLSSCFLHLFLAHGYCKTTRLVLEHSARYQYAKMKKFVAKFFFCSPYRNTASNNGRGSACCARREWEPTSTGRPSQRRSGGRLPLTLTKHFKVNWKGEPYCRDDVIIVQVP